MAFTPDQQAQIFRGAMGMLPSQRDILRRQGRPLAAINEANLTARLMRSDYGQYPGANYQSMRAIARRAVAAEHLGQVMSRSQTRVPTNSEIPVVPTLSANNARYRYDLLITTRGAGGREVVHGPTVVSSTPLSYDQVRAKAAGRIDYDESGRRSTRDALIRLGPSAVDVEFEIRGVSRIR